MGSQKLSPEPHKAQCQGTLGHSHSLIIRYSVLVLAVCTGLFLPPRSLDQHQPRRVLMSLNKVLSSLGQLFRFSSSAPQESSSIHEGAGLHQHFSMCFMLLLEPS